MLDVSHFRKYVVRPALHHIGMYSEAAENLIVGTAVQESRLTYLHQKGGGPALGIYQIEPATHKDVWDNYLGFRPELAGRVRGVASQQEFVSAPDHDLVFNLWYATIIARIIYRRAKPPLPDADDILGLAAYWKDYYNSALGAGTKPEFILNYRTYVG